MQNKRNKAEGHVNETSRNIRKSTESIKQSLSTHETWDDSNYHIFLSRLLEMLKPELNALPEEPLHNGLASLSSIAEKDIDEKESDSWFFDVYLGLGPDKVLRQKLKSNAEKYSNQLTNHQRINALSKAKERIMLVTNTLLLENKITEEEKPMLTLKTRRDVGYCSLDLTDEELQMIMETNLRELRYAERLKKNSEP